MDPKKMKLDDALRRLREELGKIRSCGMIMAHAQAADMRNRYLKRLNERVASMDSLLEKLLKDPEL